MLAGNSIINCIYDCWHNGSSLWHTNQVTIHSAWVQQCIPGLLLAISFLSRYHHYGGIKIAQGWHMLMVIHVCTWRCLLLRYDECRQLIPITAASVKPRCTGPCLQSTAGIVAKDDVLRAFPLAGPRDCWLAIRCVKIRWQYNMVAVLLYLVCKCKSMGYGQQYCMCMHKCCTVTCSSWWTCRWPNQRGNYTCHEAWMCSSNAV